MMQIYYLQVKTINLCLLVKHKFMLIYQMLYDRCSLYEGGRRGRSATFNNISVISWRSVLLVEDTGVPREDHRRVAVTDKLYHIML
jgi:hypothetical protein